jgi:hypothetical protein
MTGLGMLESSSVTEVSPKDVLMQQVTRRDHFSARKKVCLQLRLFPRVSPGDSGPEVPIAASNPSPRVGILHPRFFGGSVVASGACDDRGKLRILHPPSHISKEKQNCARVWVKYSKYLLIIIFILY